MDLVKQSTLQFRKLDWWFQSENADRIMTSLFHILSIQMILLIFVNGSESIKIFEADTMCA